MGLAAEVLTPHLMGRWHNAKVVNALPGKVIGVK